jgi:type IV secretion system protein TrbL
MRVHRIVLSVLAIAVIPAQALADVVHPCLTQGRDEPAFLTGIATQFGQHVGAWTDVALGYAQHLFLALVAIEIAWSAITYVLQKDSLSDFLAALILKLLAVGFFYMLIQPQLGPVWISEVITSFSQAGSAIGGQPPLGPSDPSTVYSCGTDLANAMLQSISKNNTELGIWNILPATEGILAALFSAFGVIIAFAIVAGQLLMTLIESYICVGAGIFMLGFTGSRWTLVIGQGYIGYVFSVGIKLFMLELIVGLGYTLGQEWSSLFEKGLAPPETYLEVAGAALIFGVLAWQLPSLAASLMNGTPRFTLGTAISTAGAAAVSGMVGLAGARALVGNAQIAVQRGLSRLSEATKFRSTQPPSDAGANGLPTSSVGPSSTRAARDSTGSPQTGAQRGTVGDAATASARRQGVSAGETEPQARDTSSQQVASGATRGDAPASDTHSSGVATSPTGAPAPTTPAPQSGSRPPPIGAPAMPSDVADGGVQIRFSHPE